MLLDLLIPLIGDVLKRVIPDPVQAAQAQTEIIKAISANQGQLLDAAKAVIVAEAQSESVLARNWRPVLMYLIMGLIAWIAVIAPIFGLTDVTLKALQGVPADLWNLQMIGLGGYVVGRSGEKIAEAIAGKK